MNEAAIYARVSTQAQAEDDKLSLEVQIQACQAYAAEHGFTVVPECVARETYTSTTMYRPELDRLLAEMARRGVQILLVDKSDRVTREGQVVAGAFVQRLRESGITLHIVAEGLVLDNPMTDAVFLNMAFSANLVNIQRAQRIQANRRAQAKVRGRYNKSSRAPYGFRFEDTPDGMVHLRHNPETFPILERMIRERGMGWSFHRIADRLTRDAIPTPTAHDGRRNAATGWLGSSVKAILSNPVLSGQPVAFRTKWTEMPPDAKHPHRWHAHRATPDETRIALPPSIVEDPPLTPAEQRRLVAKKPNPPRREGAPDLFPGGMLRHGECGGGLRTHWARGRGGKLYRYYDCLKSRDQPSLYKSFSTRAEPLEHLIWRAIRRLFLEPETLDVIIRAQIAAEVSGDQQSELARLRKVRADLGEQQRRLVDILSQTTDHIVQRALREKLERLSPDIADVEKRIGEYETALGDVVGLEQLLKDVRLRTLLYRKILAHPTPEQAATVLRILGVRGLVDRLPDKRLDVRLSLTIDRAAAQPWFGAQEEARLMQELLNELERRGETTGLDQIPTRVYNSLILAELTELTPDDALGDVHFVGPNSPPVCIRQDCQG